MPIEIKIPTRAKKILEDFSRDITLIAHRRWYKTRLAIMKCIFGNKKHKGAIKDPKTNYFIVLPTYKQAKMVAWDILKDETRALTGKPNEQSLEVTFANGSKISLKGGDKPDSLRGPGLDGLVLDEWAFHDKPEVSTKILRPALADRKGWRMKTSSLNGENHCWEDYLNSDSRYLFKASETGVLDEEELAVMRSDMSEEEYLQEMECTPLKLSGAIYKEFDESQDVIKEKDYFEIDPNWELIVGLDWGISHNTAICFCAVDYDGNFLVYDEIVNNDKPVEYYAPLIKKKMEGKQYDFYISPDTLKKDKFRGGVRYSVFQEFCEQGLFPQIANNSVSAGINKVKQLFINKKCKIFERCTELIAGLKRYRWKANVASGDEAPAKIKDDEVEAFRYGVATYFTAAKKDTKQEAQELSVQWFKDRRKDKSKSQGVGQYAIIR